MLAIIMTNQQVDGGAKYLAALVLKNTLRNHVMLLKTKQAQGDQELNAVKETLLNSLLTQMANTAFEKKLKKETIHILTKVTVLEYFADPPSITRVLDLFCASYNPTVVRLVNQIYKDAQDDRMSNLVNRLLTSAQRYIFDEHCMASNDIKLVQLIVMLFQSMQWAVGVDKAVIKTGVEGIDMANLVNAIVTKGLTMITNPLKTLAQLEEAGETDKDNIAFVKQRATVTKLLTILFRDFPRILGSNEKSDMYKVIQGSVWDLCVKNLTYMLPFY